MLKNLKIKQKIVMMQMIAGITFVLIIVILAFLNNYIKNLSSNIQTEYYPLLEKAQIFNDDFDELQRGLQDAVGTADSAAIFETDIIYDSLSANIKNSSKIFKNKKTDFEKLHNSLQEYYYIAKNVSIRLISEATDEAFVEDLELMTEKYNAIKNKFDENVIYYKEVIASEFENLHYYQNLSLFVIAFATFLAIVLIGWFSYKLVISITKPLKEVVHVANEVGSGNLDVEVTTTSNDEIGVLKSAFREMIKKINLLLNEKDRTLKKLKSEVKVREKTERELNKHKNNLEVLVVERTQALESTNINLTKEIDIRKNAENKQKQLIEEVESINQELKNFAYVVSHDLKAPLRAIGSLSDWLATDYANKLDDEGKELIRLLDTRVKRMHNLIEGILQYSRVGRVMEEKVKVDLNDTVKNAIDLLSPPENISVKVDNKLPIVLFEKTRIEQVFQNLISNAIKYMDKPEGEIEIGVDNKNGFWNIYFKDNGPGIEEKYFEKIFQIFQTLNARDNFESTGVGLSLVKKILEMYGGTIWVESEMGVGSTFIIALPKKISVKIK